jgi:hypothetical protein
MQAWSFNRLGGYLAAFVGAGGLLYGILFAFISRGSGGAGVIEIWLVLGILGGLGVTGVFVALYERLKVTEHSYALWAVLLGVFGGLGQMLNSSIALGGVIQGPAVSGSVDPVGLFRFGLNGLALLLFGMVMLRAAGFPRDLAWLGLIGGALLVIMYAGRLTGFITPANEITLLPPLVYGFVVHPIFYLWLARILMPSPAPARAAAP